MPRFLFLSAFLPLVLLLVALPARAELRLRVSPGPDQRLVLQQAPSSQPAELVGVGPDDIPMFGPVDCATLGARHLKRARADTLDIDVIVARYNLVNAWTGNLCSGANDPGLDPREARAWLDQLAGLSREEDGTPFIDARRRLAEVLTFGAPGVSPDPAEARRYALQESATDPAMLLYLAYTSEHGLGGPADERQALEFLRRAGERGDATARTLLAQAAELGLYGVERNEADAVARYSALAQVVNPPVWFRLGRMLLDGRGAPRDPCRARDLLERAQRHAWTPVPEAQAYLENIRQQDLCPVQRGQ